MIESSNTEFKREFTDSILKTVVAFANTDGGCIYIGIEDDGTVVGVADVDDVREAHDKYQSRVKQSESIYGDATKSIVSSNDARTKAAEQALNLHGMKLEDLTNDQEQYMNDVYADLKAHGLEESVAAFIAALSTAGVATQQNNDGKFALENDKDVRYR